MKFIAWFVATMTLPFSPLLLLLWPGFHELPFAIAFLLVGGSTAVITMTCLSRLFTSA